MLSLDPSAPAWPGPPAEGGSAAGRKLQRRGREPVPSLLPAGPPSSPSSAAAALSGSQSHLGQEGRGAGLEGGPKGAEFQSPAVRGSLGQRLGGGPRVSTEGTEGVYTAPPSSPHTTGVSPRAQLPLLSFGLTQTTR